MDPKETARLMALMAERGHKFSMEARTREELDAMGLEAHFDGVPLAASEGVAACITIIPGEQLRLPDNKTGPCAWGCGRTVQFRPWVTRPTVCLYCCAERSTKDQ